MMNINNGVPNGNNMAGVPSWHGMYTGEERQRVVQIIMDTLSDLHGTNPNFDFQKLTKMAQDFERIVYEKSPSRDDYLKAIKLKVSQLRLQKQQVNGGQSVSPNNQVNQQQQQISQQMARNALNTNPNMGPANTQNLQFLQQQAQARNQSQAQIQARQQQLRQMVNSQQGQGMQSSRPLGAVQPNPQQQTTQQQLQQQQQQQQQTNFTQRQALNANGPTGADQQVPPQLLQLIRSSPIPPPLLTKIPNLPKGVTTWNQIFDCIKRKVISQDILPLVRDIHSTHMQLVMRQQQQKMNVRNEGNIAGNNTNQINDNELKTNQGNPPIGQVNFNNLTPQQRQQLLQRQRESQQQRQLSLGANQPGPGLNQDFGQQGLPQQQGLSQQGPPRPVPQQPVPAQKAPFQHPQLQQQQQHQQQPQQSFDQRPPQFQVTQQDYAKYSNDALTLLNRLQQQKQIAGQLDSNMKETFIRKYILHQKNQLWKQQIAAQSGSTGLGIQNAQSQAQQPIPQIAPNVPIPMQLNGGNLQGKQVPISQQGLPMIGTSNTPLMKPNMAPLNNLSSPVPNQRGPVMNDSSAPPGRAGPAAANPSLSSLLPPLTDEAKLRLRQLIEEVSRNNVLLRDVTTLLSPKDKGAVRDSMNRIQEEYGNVDSIISYFYLFTKNIEGTKRLIQMKYMTKNILENLKRGVYLAGPDLLDKLRNQYAKYFDYVKEQISQRRQQIVGGRNPGVPPQPHAIQGQQQQPPLPPGQQQQSQPRGPPQPQMQAQGVQPMVQNAQGVIEQMFGNSNVQNSPHLFAPTFNQSPQQLNQGLPPQIPQQQQQQQQQFANQGMPMVGGLGPQPTQQQMQMNQTWGNAGNVQNNMQQQFAPNGQQQGVQQVPLQQRNSVLQTKPKKAPPKKKRNSTAAAAATPNAIASSIKTPHNVATPQIQNSLQSPQIKSTPAPSAPTPKPNAPPSVPATTAPSTGPATVSGTTPNTHTTPEIDIFSMSSDLVKRRELSLTDPQQFFVESLRKLLELDGQSKESRVNSAATLCAISTSFRQVQEIDEVCENVF